MLNPYLIDSGSGSAYRDFSRESIGGVLAGLHFEFQNCTFIFSKRRTRTSHVLTIFFSIRIKRFKINIIPRKTNKSLRLTIIIHHWIIRIKLKSKEHDISLFYINSATINMHGPV